MQCKMETNRAMPDNSSLQPTLLVAPSNPSDQLTALEQQQREM